MFWLSRDSIDIGYTTETGYLETILKETKKSIPTSCTQQIREMILKKKLPAPPSLDGTKTGLKKYITDNITFPSSKEVRKASGFVTFLLGVNENGSIDSIQQMKSTLKKPFLQIVSEVLENMPVWKKSDTVTGRVKYNYTIRVYFYIESKHNKRFIVSAGKPKMISLCAPDTVSALAFHYNLPIYDTTVLSVFNRHTDWNNMVIVGDLTGSMSPYTAQLIVWYQLVLNGEKNKVKYFNFFNDGNSKMDDKKMIGSTGGIYGGTAQTIDQLNQLITKTMNAGSGGDLPENNMEALIDAIKKNPDCKELVMVADNWATPRDMTLLKYVNRPVKIILCGTYGSINPAYLDIARATHGSVYTIENDITDLAKLSEGQTIQVGTETFRITNGKFVKVSKS